MDARAKALAAALLAERVSALVQHTAQRLRAEGAVFIDGGSVGGVKGKGGGSCAYNCYCPPFHAYTYPPPHIHTHTYQQNRARR